MRKYLIVDDNQAFAENIAEILRDLGHEVAVAVAGAAALEAVGRDRFDAVLTDMRMPLMGGGELVHRIRQIDPGLPAIVITAYTNDDDISAAKREGLLAVLGKPVPVERLVDLLAQARRGGLVAIVEDDPALSDNLAEALRVRGFSAVLAQTVLDTDKLGQVAPFCAIVDLRMPGGPDGEAMKRLGARFPGLPMLVVTAHDQISPPVAPVEKFHKPFRTEALMEAVERLWKHG